MFMARKTRYFFLGLACATALLAAGGAGAASVFDIVFPIPELEGCADRAACKAYCDDGSHGDACLAFAQKYGLADQKAAAKAQAVEARGGPGGCNSVDACKAYCDDQGHQDECTDYAVQNGFMSKEDGERAKKSGPGGCRGSACQTYCADPAHEEECSDFAVKNGFISKEAALLRGNNALPTRFFGRL